MPTEDIISKDINPESLFPNDVEADPAGMPYGLKKRQKGQPNVSRRLSICSSNYDVGNKGYLDETELTMRAYDMNNDGSLDANELKKIILDLHGNKKEKNMMKKIACFTTATLAIVLLCNFGLVWATLVLSRVGTQNGSLVDPSTGEKISTRASNLGNHVVAKVNPEYARRLIQLHGRRVLSRATGAVDGFSFHEGYRRLNDEIPVATLDESGEALGELFHDYEDGTIPTVSIEVEGTTYTGSVASGVTFTPQVDGCDVYDNIKEQGTDEPTYEIKCCDTAQCEVKQNGSSVFTRRLEGKFREPPEYCTLYNDCENTRDTCEHSPNQPPEWGMCKSSPIFCFSPLSTIMEKSKGQMFLKDLKTGDLVLAANGKYRPFLISAHSSPSKLTHFVQIHTGSSKDVPLEATPNHLVFLHGNNVPVAVGKVKVGDLMVGVDGPRAVTKTTSVMRKGFYNALTSDATLVVDGVLASSTSTLTGEGEEYIHFGLFQVHVHTLVSWVGAPLIHFGCSKVDSFYCTTQVGDGSGGALNVLISSGRAVMTLPWPLQPLIFTFFIVVAAIGMICYHLALFLVPGAILLAIMTTFQLKKKEKQF